MDWQAWITLGVVALAVAAMAKSLAGPDLILLAGLALLLAFGVVTPEEALAGFANPAIISVAALFVVAAGLQETGGLDFVARRLLGRPKTVAGAQLRLMAPVAIASAFLNNTPVVALMVPIVEDWARRSEIAISKLLIPLSYAAILGGTCTLIGTSTNLVVAGLADGLEPSVSFGLFDIAWLGLPTTLCGITLVLSTSRWLLPRRDRERVSPDSPREYTVAMRVQGDSPVVNRTVEDAGLRHLPGLFLVEIVRGEETFVAVGPNAMIREDDILIFAGIVDSVVDLRKIRGLVPATNQVEKLGQRSPNRRLVEAVIAAHSPLLGKSIRDSRFRTRFDAAIIAVHRQGERVRGRIGDIVMRAGDTLLLETHPRFLNQNRHDSRFALVSEVDGSTPPRHDRAWIAGLILVAMVAINVIGVLPLITAALLAAGAMVATRCLTGAQARRSLELPVLVAIAASFGIAAALEKTGVAGFIAHGIVDVARPLGPVGVLAAIYLATAILTELVTNNAAAALMFPVATAAAEAAGIDLHACLLLLMIAASASFATPLGYQTNLMVMGPGGYRFGDFFRIGVPLQVVVGALAVTIASLLWL